jgi:hypothetical protein
LALLANSNAENDSREHGGYTKGGGNRNPDHADLGGNWAIPETGRQQCQVH